MSVTPHSQIKSEVHDSNLVELQYRLSERRVKNEIKHTKQSCGLHAFTLLFFGCLCSRFNPLHNTKCKIEKILKFKKKTIPHKVYNKSKTNSP